MLDTQINMYSVDTGHFYSNSEKYLHEMNCKYRQERNYLNNKLSEMEKDFKKIGLTKKDFSKWKQCSIDDYYNEDNDDIKEYLKWCLLIQHKRKKANQSKQKLLTILSNKMTQKEAMSQKLDEYKSNNTPYNKKIELRELRSDELRDTNVISVFESTLTRVIGIQKD